MSSRPSLRGLVLGTLAAIVALGLVPVGAVAHLGESSHLHVPGDATTPGSAVWCVRFTQDPGVWRPEGQTAVDPSSMGGTSIVFFDCAEILDGHYTIESYEGGQVARATVGEPVLGESSASTRTTDEADTTEATEASQPLTVKAWTRHQKQWLAKGDKLAARLGKVRTVEQARTALGALQRFLASETRWLKANKGRFDPDTCVAEDKTRWEQRVKEAQKSLNKAVTAVNRGNIAAANTSIRQFARAWTKVEQIYRIGMCDF